MEGVNRVKNNYGSETISIDRYDDFVVGPRRGMEQDPLGYWVSFEQMVALEKVARGFEICNCLTCRVIRGGGKADTV